MGQSIFVKEALRRELDTALRNDSVAEIEDVARRLARRAPTDEFPYEAALAVAYSEGNFAAADTFATYALMRQPRSLAGHLHMFSAYAERKEYDLLLRQFENLARLRSLDEELLTEALIGVFQDSGQWHFLLSYLDTEPKTGNLLLRRLLNEDVILLRLAKLVKKYPSVQAEFIDRIISEKGIEVAFSLWQTFASVPNKNEISIVFNGEFQTRAEPPPFNWTIPYDRAELQEDGGLFVSYPGTGFPLIARQVITAQSGENVLITQAIGRMHDNGGALEWRIRCLRTHVQLHTSVIELVSVSAAEEFEATFNIPDSECAFQAIELHGRPGVLPKPARVEIVSVSINGSPKDKH